MSAVYRAYDPVLDREIAIKVLPENLAREPVYRKRFVEEARALAKVEHPNLVRIYAVGQEGPISYYAMELVHGLALRDAIRSRGRFSLREAMAIFEQFLRALVAVHAAGIVHRDVKPGNIMLSTDGRVVLMDFGLARRVERQALTVPGTVVGTPEYMAPEQAKGEPADARADLYSAGVVLYEMLSGAPPYGGPDTLAILRKHVEAPVPSFSEALADLGEELDAILRRFLAKRPDERIPSAQAALDALRPWLPQEQEAIEIVRKIVADAQRIAERRTRSFAPPPPGSPAASSISDTAGSSSLAVGAPAPIAQTSFLSRFVPWVAMGIALIAVLVAVLSLFRTGPASGGVWRRVVLRDGRAFAGRLEKWEPLPNGDARLIYRRPSGSSVTVRASEIRFDVARTGRPWVPLVVVLFALGCVIAMLALLVAMYAIARRTGSPPGPITSQAAPPCRGASG